MAIRSGIFGGLTAVVLTLLLGNRWTIDNLPSGGPAPVASRSVAAFFSWDPSRLGGSVKTATYVALVVLVLATAILGAAAGRARPLAAFVGGWGAAVGAGALSGIAFTTVAGDDGRFGSGNEIIDRWYASATTGAGPMIAVGWLVGLAVLLGSFGAKQPKVAPAGGGYAPPPGPPAPGAPPPGYGAPPAWEQPQPPPAAPASHDGPTPAYGTPAPAPPPPPPPAGPSIGPPPDRTQVYGQPQQSPPGGC